MYKFDPAGVPLTETFRAIALSQLDEVLGELDKPDADLEATVHEGRRRCKKLRGLLRLARPAFPDFAEENAALRDAAVLLSHLRDDDVLRHTVRELAENSNTDGDRLRQIADRLGHLDRQQARSKLDAFRDALNAVRQRAVSWALSKQGEAPLLAGLRDTYRKGRRLMRKAERSRAASDMHEWRKATKNHGFHLDLLKRVAPDLLEDDLKTVETLATCLGLHHDLAVLSDAIARNAGRFGGSDEVAVVRDAIAGRIPLIEAKAFELGRQIFAERPSALARRFDAYWHAA